MQQKYQIKIFNTFIYNFTLLSKIVVMKRFALFTFLLLFSYSLIFAGNKPNIIIIYADDLGYGDVGAYGSVAIKTPNIDKLADGGVRFTRGYASSSTCTPSRYALLTGSYPWRNKRAHILPGSAPLIIDTAAATIPKMLKEQGYRTGIVGKWHLGLGNGKLNWNEHISPGPNETGFDYSFIMAATQDRVPTVYIENGYIVNLNPDNPIEVSYQHQFPEEITGREHPELLKMMYDFGHDGTIVNGISRIGHQKGGEEAWWVDENMADIFLEKVRTFIKTNKGQPFFLYYALQQPHVPRTPNPRFVGATELGPRGDAIVEEDWCVGELIKTLESEGLLENTFIIFSSDNGPVLNDGYKDEAAEKNDGHKPWGSFRGGKYSLYEAGTRLPFITYWKGKISPDTCDAMISQIDILNSLASLTGSKIRTNDGEDLIKTFLGKSKKGRESMVTEATGRTAYRKGYWVMIPPHKGPAVAKAENIELGNSKEYQLFNLKNDPAQQHNLARTYPDKLKEIITEYEHTVKP
jgi:arylsulfatase A-like enzyme